VAQAAVVTTTHDGGHDHHGHAVPYTSTGISMWKLGFWVFLGSETLFFGSFIATYMVYKHESVVGPFPIDLFNIGLTSFSTFVLLMSSLAMVLALDALQHRTRKQALFFTLATATLGMVFLACQAYEFTHFYHEGLTLQKNLFGSTFYILTGFHGAHVSIGVMWLLIMAIDIARGRTGPNESLRLEIAGLYWHFVDIVWIVIFTLVYLIK
jgi:heme/copper-type cytochrome/quinol oxidase subunit 3